MKLFFDLYFFQLLAFRRAEGLAIWARGTKGMGTSDLNIEYCKDSASPAFAYISE